MIFYISWKLSSKYQFLRNQEFKLKMSISSLIFMKCKISCKSRMNAIESAFESLNIIFYIVQFWVPLGYHGDTYIWLKWSHKSVIYHNFLSSKPIYSHNMVPKWYLKFHNSKVWPLSFQTHNKSHSYDFYIILWLWLK